MPGLKKYHNDFKATRDGVTLRNKVTPDEVDGYKYTRIYYPTASASWFGTAEAGSAAEAKAFVITQAQADYPRTVLVTVTNSSGSVCTGTCDVTGTDQFGDALTESIALSGTETTLKAGTGIFKTVTSATITFGTATEEDGTATLGVAIGTTAGQVGRFGLGYKIGAAADVKMITWINNGTATGLDKGTVNTTLVSAASHSFQGTKILAKTDIYTVQALPTYNNLRFNSKISKEFDHFIK